MLALVCLDLTVVTLGWPAGVERALRLASCWPRVFQLQARSISPLSYAAGHQVQVQRAWNWNRRRHILQAPC